MSIKLNHPCTRCINSIKRDPGVPYGKHKCNAFPAGIPYEFLWQKDVTQLKECNNGYKFEEST